MAKLGADIYLDDKNTLSFYTTQNWFTGGGDGRTLISENGTVLAISPSIQNQENKTGSYNVNYKKEFENSSCLLFRTTTSKFPL